MHHYPIIVIVAVLVAARLIYGLVRARRSRNK